ncbi:Unknown protein, partial [Striga hermonthica]
TYIDIARSIARSDITLSADECSRSLFGKIIGDRTTSWIGVERTMTNIWRLSHDMEIKELSPNYFQFIFQSREDKLKVANGINWSFENQYLVLKEWRMGISSKHPCFNELNLWVQVTNTPLDWLSTEVGLKIGKVFKQVKNVVLANADNHGGKYLRLLVTLNLEEPLPRVSNIRLGEQTAQVGFKYEKLLNLSLYCGMIGHLDRNCSKRITDINNNSLKEGQYDDFMKVSEGLKRFDPTSSGSKGTPHTESPKENEHMSHPHISSHQAETSQQLIHIPDVTPATLNEGDQDSVASASHSPSNQEALVESSLQIVESYKSKAMEVDPESPHPISNYSISETLPSQTAQLLRTWRRDRSKDGRLLRESTSIIISDQKPKGKRTRIEDEDNSASPDDSLQNQSVPKKSKLQLQK